MSRSADRWCSVVVIETRNGVGRCVGPEPGIVWLDAPTSDDLVMAHAIALLEPLWPI